MQFRIRESSGTRKNIDKSLIFLAKNWRSVYFPHFRNSCFEGSLDLGISILRDPSFWEFLFWGIPHFRNFGTGMKQAGFLKGFCPFFVLFFASSRTICTWHGYFSKKSDPACFFWPQGPLIQKSAAPQGSPPPTQQINIRNTNQWSWAINYCGMGWVKISKSCCL